MVKALAARAADMVTLDAWCGLARAVAAARGKTTADLLGASDLPDIAAHSPGDRHAAVDGRLPRDE